MVQDVPLALVFDYRSSYGGAYRRNSIEGHVRLRTLSEGHLADERSTILEKNKRSVRHLSGQRAPSPSASVP